MKKTRVVFLVLFMLSVSILAFESIGEELSKGDKTSDSAKVYGLTYEIQNIKKNMNTNALQKTRTFIEPDLAIMNQAMATVQYNQVKKNTIYDAERTEHYQETLEERVQIILELTPLDVETAKIVLEYSDKYNIRPSLILGVMDLESNFSQFMVGTSQDRGYMQIIPGTEKWLANAYGEELGLTYDPDRIFEADYNIPLAVKYLSVLDQQYKGNTTKMLTSYNRGDAGLKKWFAEHGTYETAYSRVVLKREQKYLDVK